MIYLKVMDAVKLWRGGKESTCQCKRYKRHGFDLWMGKISGVGNVNPFQYSCLRNSRDRGTSWVIVRKSQTGHKDQTTTTLVLGGKKIKTGPRYSLK